MNKADTAFILAAAGLVFLMIPGLALFYGGMVMTCGLSNVGGPCVDQGEELGRHPGS